MSAEPSADPPRRSLRRVFGRLAAALGAGSLFMASLIGGAYLHLDRPATRRVVRAVGERVLDDTFAGEFEIGEVEILDDETIVVDRFAAFDPEGRRVILAEGVRLRGRWLAELVTFGLRPGPELVLPDVRVETGEVVLHFDQGSLSLARAFHTARDPEKPTEPPAREAPPPFTVVLGRIELGAIDVKGDLSPSVSLDARVSRLAASLRAGNRGVSLHVERSSIEERALFGATAEGTTDYHLEVAVEHARETSVAMGASFAGRVGPIELTTEARLDDGVLAVVMDLPRVGPKELRPWLPTSPLGRPVAARAAILGRPPELEIRGEVLVPAIGDEPPAQIAMQGDLSLAQEVLVEATVEAIDLDARLFDATIPRTQLSARAHVAGRLAGAESEIAVTFASSKSDVGGEVVPPLEGRAEITQAGITTYLVAREPGLSLDAGLRYRPQRPVEVAFQAEGTNLAAVPRLADLLPGGAGGRARVDGQAWIAADHVDVTLDASGQGLRLPGSQVRLGSGRVRARIHGPPDRLSIEAQGHGSRLDAGGQAIESFQIAASGPLARPTVTATGRDRERREIEARGVVDPQAGVASGITVEVRRDGDTLRGTVRRVSARGGQIDVQGVALEGLGGGLQGDMRVVRGELQGRLTGRDLEVDPLLRLVGVRLPYRLDGRAQIEIELEPSPEGRNGSLRIAVEDGRMLHFGADVELLASFDGPTVRPQLVVRLEGNPQFREADDVCASFGTLVLAGEAELSGAILDPTTWLEAQGEGAAHLAGLRLRCVKEEWPFLPIGELEGEINASVQLALDPDRWLPTIPAFALHTRGLVIAPTAAEGAAPAWRSASLDLSVSGSFDGGSGKTHLDLAALDARDPRPEPFPIAMLQGDLDLDLEAMDAGGERFERSIETMPIAASLRVPRKPIARLAALPSPWGEPLAGIEGDMSLHVVVEGTPREPALAARVRGYDLVPPGVEEAWQLPTDVDLMASYHAGAGRLDGAILREGRTVATVAGESRGDLGERLFGGHDERWTGWLEAKLRALPLESLPFGEGGAVRGAVSGRVRVDGLGADPVLDVALEVPELRIGPSVVFDGALLRVRPEPERPGVVTVEAALPLRGATPRGLLVSAYATVRWRDELYPRPDGDEPAGLSLVLSDFPLETLEPFAGPSVGRLAGEIDGKIALTSYGTGDEQTALDVELELERGLVQLPGLELRDVEAQVRSQPGLIEVRYFRAGVQAGRVSGDLSMRLRGLEPLDLAGRLVVANDQRIPLSIDGVPLGAVSGEVNVSVLRRPNEAGSHDNLVRIESPHLRLRLPAAAGKELQPLEQHPDMTISHALREPEPEAPPDDGAKTTLLVKLDRLVLEGGAEVRIVLQTSPDDPPRVVIDGPASGKILITEGELNLFGKTFLLDRGVVRLLPDDVDNPHVNVTAHWNAPDGTVVFVDYIGQLNPITGDKIRFRSTPPRSPQEIVSLLLLGDAPSSEVASSETERAGALSQGIAAAQMNALLGQLAPGLSTSFGTTNEGYVATTVTYQFTDEVTGSATFEQAAGEVQATQNDDPRTTFSVDWRFAPHWLIRGSVGVGEGATSGLDLLFQYRY